MDRSGPKYLPTLVDNEWIVVQRQTGLEKKFLLVMRFQLDLEANIGSQKLLSPFFV